MKLLISILLLTTMSYAQSREQRLTRIFDDLHIKPNDPGIAAVILDHSEPKFVFTRGMEKLKLGRPISDSTNFRLASCTKQFTAMAIMLLVHDGKLKYDDTLTKLFPGFPAYGKNITVRNLLNHTSGLPDYEDLMDLPQNKSHHWSADHQITDAEVLALLKQATATKFPPGTKWSYSNSGYVMLGNIVAKVSGETFPQFLQDRIFAPLKMTRTVAFVHGMNQVPVRAYGHSPLSAHAGVYQQTDQSSTSATLGDGGVYSNLKDLAKWDAALVHHTLLSEEEMKPALTPFKLPDGSLPKWSGDSGDEDPQHGKPVEYGFGWYLDPVKDNAGRMHERMWHYGDTIGFKSAIMRFPKDGVTIIVLANRSDFDAVDVATKLEEAYFQR